MECHCIIMAHTVSLIVYYYQQQVAADSSDKVKRCSSVQVSWLEKQPIIMELDNL